MAKKKRLNQKLKLLLYARIIPNLGLLSKLMHRLCHLGVAPVAAGGSSGLRVKSSRLTI